MHMNHVPKFGKGLAFVSLSMRTARYIRTYLAKCSQHGEEQFPRVRWCEGVQEKACAVSGTGAQAKQEIGSLDGGYRIPLATRQRSRARDFTYRAGMVLGKPRDVEKGVRMPPAAMRSALKDMVCLEGGFWRGNGGRCK